MGKRLPGSSVLSSEAEGRASPADGSFGHTVGAHLDTKSVPIKVESCFIFSLKCVLWASHQDFLLPRPVRG